MYIIKSQDGFYWTGEKWSTSVHLAKRYSTIPTARRVIHSPKLLGHSVDLFELVYLLKTDELKQIPVKISGLPEQSEKAFLKRIEQAKQSGNNILVEELEVKYARLFG